MVPFPHYPGPQWVIILSQARNLPGICANSTRNLFNNYKWNRKRKMTKIPSILWVQRYSGLTKIKHALFPSQKIPHLVSRLFLPRLSPVVLQVWSMNGSGPSEPPGNSTEMSSSLSLCQTYGNRTSGVGPAICVVTSPQGYCDACWTVRTMALEHQSGPRNGTAT